MRKKRGAFDNVETQHQNQVSLCLYYLTCTYHFRKNWLCTLGRVFIMVSFYYDARLMHKIGK